MAASGWRRTMGLTGAGGLLALAVASTSVAKPVPMPPIPLADAGANATAVPAGEEHAAVVVVVDGARWQDVLVGIDGELARDAGMDPRAANEPAMPRLARDLNDVCSGRIDPAELLRARTGGTSPWRERPSPAVPTEILLDDRASPRHTVVEVFAKDRPGLLYTLSHALHDLGLSITLSKINTEGARVADVFYVGELDGSKVARGPRYQQIHDALVRAVG